jgi:hypothetical protein
VRGLDAWLGAAAHEPHTHREAHRGEHRAEQRRAIAAPCLEHDRELAPRAVRDVAVDEAEDAPVALERRREPVHERARERLDRRVRAEQALGHREVRAERVVARHADADDDEGQELLVRDRRGLDREAIGVLDAPGVDRARRVLDDLGRGRPVVADPLGARRLGHDDDELGAAARDVGPEEEAALVAAEHRRRALDGDPALLDRIAGREAGVREVVLARVAIDLERRAVGLQRAERERQRAVGELDLADLVRGLLGLEADDRVALRDHAAARQHLVDDAIEEAHALGLGPALGERRGGERGRVDRERGLEPARHADRAALVARDPALEREVRVAEAAEPVDRLRHAGAAPALDLDDRAEHAARGGRAALGFVEQAARAGVIAARGPRGRGARELHLGRG